MVRRFLTILTISLTLTLGFAGIQAWAAKEPASPEFTLEQAVEKAKANSQTLKSMKYDINRSYEVRQYVGDKVTFTPLEASDSEADATFKSLMSADLNWRMAKRSYDAQEDTLVMQTYKIYYGLLQAIEDVKVAESQLKNAEWKHRVAAANYRVGLLNKMGMLEADAALAEAKANLEAANKALEDAYQKFNQLVGLWPEDRPVLVDKPSFNEVKIDNLDYEVAKAKADCPSIWLARQKIDLAKINLDLYSFNNASEPYVAKKIDVDKTEIAVEDADEQMDKLVRTLYYTIKQSEEQYANAMDSVKTAEESLRVIKVKYDVGMATLAEVRAAEAALVKAENSVFDLACQHEIQAYAFQKPWAYAAS
ncbi:MAG: Outer membrane efflux protein [Pelotomaculum sp. PtaB.Bin104]|nr:MAG: Outer membrane efflux protein [Pelotomaculum sp. PtaB.Bin104]